MTFSQLFCPLECWRLKIFLFLVFLVGFIIGNWGWFPSCSTPVCVRPRLVRCSNLRNMKLNSFNMSFAFCQTLPTVTLVPVQGGQTETSPTLLQLIVSNVSLCNEHERDIETGRHSLEFDSHTICYTFAIDRSTNRDTVLISWTSLWQAWYQKK